MENKKIYVDGVDVSKCYRYQKKTGYCKGAFKPEELPFCENFDCEFKKLARKMQECDRYRKALEEIEEYCNNVLSFTAVRTTESDILNIINKAKGEIMEIT